MDLMLMLRSYKAQAEVLMPSCETLMPSLSKHAEA